MASYKAFHRHYQLPHFTTSVKGGNLTPCFEAPERPSSNYKGRSGLRNGDVRKVMERRLTYHRKLFGALGARHGLAHAYHLVLLQAADIILQSSLADLLPRGEVLLDLANDAATKCEILFGLGALKPQREAIMKKFPSRKLRLEVREGGPSSWPCATAIERPLFDKLALVVLSQRQDEPGEVTLSWPASPLTRPIYDLAYKVLALFPASSQAARLEARRNYCT